LQENAKLHYGNPADFTLTVPEFSIKPGEVVAIVGRVGCGKQHWNSQLLQSSNARHCEWQSALASDCSPWNKTASCLANPFQTPL
jgi:ABC-type transport system involved in cytochrome bd biosynthesis fused ATPase/permease subunit